MNAKTMDEVGRFLAESPIAERVSIPTVLILERRRLSAAELEAARAAGTYVPSLGLTCELEAGGQVVARGKIVRRGGKSFFKVTETGGAV